MNKIVTLAFLLLSGFSYGKTTGITIPTAFPHFGSSQPNNNISVSPVRLISRVKTIYNGGGYIPFDSATYSYSNGRGGILDLEYTDKFLSFDNAVLYDYDKGTGIYKNNIRYTQTFHPDNRIEYHVQENWINNNVQWHNNVRYEYLYDVFTSRLEQTNLNIWNGSWAGNSPHFKLFYNGKDDIIEIQQNLQITYLSYDANHNVVERKEYQFTPGQGWNYSDRYSFSYDASNNLTSYTLEKLKNGNWENVIKKEYEYQNLEVSKSVEYTWANGSWKTVRQNLFSYDAWGNKLSDNFQIWDDATTSFINTRREEWTYNLQNQPLTYQSLTWNAASQSWAPVLNDFLIRYQYEFYTPTSVPTISNPKDVFTLFPQPAANDINIQFKNPSNDNYKGVISDMSGRVVKQFDVNEKQNKVPINDLPSGNYLITVNTKNQKIAQPLLIAR